MGRESIRPRHVFLVCLILYAARTVTADSLLNDLLLFDRSLQFLFDASDFTL